MVSKKTAEHHIKKLLEFIGDDPTREALVKTPERVINSFTEMFRGYRDKLDDITIFPNENHYQDIILLKKIEFSSFCEHHFLPIIGTMDIGYIPDKNIVGISKIPRIVEYVTKKLQLQEKIILEIAEIIDKHISPKAIGIRISAEHFCMKLRGVKQTNITMDNSYFTGLLKEEKYQNKFYNLLQSS